MKNVLRPEWPPSPWRVLRALVSAAYAEELSVADVEPLIERLRGLPRYRLPLAVAAHTRHWMLDVDDAGHKKTMIFDAFVAVDGGAPDPRPVTVAWPVDLTTSGLITAVGGPAAADGVGPTERSARASSSQSQRAAPSPLATARTSASDCLSQGSDPRDPCLRRCR
jgi:CRISPR-associated protein Csb2